MKKNDYKNFIKDLESLKKEYMHIFTAGVNLKEHTNNANEMMDKIYDLYTDKYSSLTNGKMNRVCKKFAIIDIEEFKKNLINQYKTYGIDCVENYIENLSDSYANWFVSKNTSAIDFSTVNILDIPNLIHIQLFDLTLEEMYFYIDLKINELKDKINEQEI